MAHARRGCRRYFSWPCADAARATGRHMGTPGAAMMLAALGRRALLLAAMAAATLISFRWPPGAAFLGRKQSAISMRRLHRQHAASHARLRHGRMLSLRSPRRRALPGQADYIIISPRRHSAPIITAYFDGRGPRRHSAIRPRRRTPTP